MENGKIVLDRIFEETGIKCNNINDFQWFLIGNKPLSENLIRDLKDKVNWSHISEYQYLSENFIREFKDKVNWEYISMYQKLSENFIKEFQNEISWFCVSRDQKLSENFIREFQNEVNWKWICKYQKISDEFIIEFKDKVCWMDISRYQKLSENFIREFKYDVYWPYISNYQNLSDEFRKEFNVIVDYDNWLYENSEFKKKQILNTGLYECHDDYFIAYKAIRKDRFSHFNFQYQYLKDQTYECHCDCTKEKNSFGLSAWTEEKAIQYNNTGIIIKVKVKYEDIGRVVHNGGKIRCFKLEVL